MAKGDYERTRRQMRRAAGHIEKLELTLADSFFSSRPQVLRWELLSLLAGETYTLEMTEKYLFIALPYFLKGNAVTQSSSM